METEKIVFLDVDGVLNCRGDRERLGDDMPMTSPNGFSGIVPERVARLAAIVKATGAGIVLVSSWKTALETYRGFEKRGEIPDVDDDFLSPDIAYYYAGKHLLDSLAAEGLSLYDDTLASERKWRKRIVEDPSAHYRGYVSPYRERGGGVAVWLSEHPEVKSWIGLDDEPDTYGDEQMDRVVATEYYATDGGLNDEHVAYAIDMLEHPGKKYSECLETSDDMG